MDLSANSLENNHSVLLNSNCFLRTASKVDHNLILEKNTINFKKVYSWTTFVTVLERTGVPALQLSMN